MKSEKNKPKYYWWIKDQKTGRFMEFTGAFLTKLDAIRWKATHGKYFETRAEFPHEFKLHISNKPQDDE